MKSHLKVALLGLLSCSRLLNAAAPSLVDPRYKYAVNVSLPDQGFPGLQSNWKETPLDSGEVSYVGSGRLKGRKALITGGDSGMGRAAAIAYAREGADVAINYVPEEQADADVVADLVQKAGGKFFGIPGDLRNESFCADLVHQAAAALGGLDILVSNAGYASNTYDISNHSTEIFDRTFRTNVYASFFLVRAAVPLLPPGSSIIFTASTTARLPVFYLVDYSATKAVLVSFARSLASQLAPRGIRVNAVAPSITATNFLTSQGQTTESTNGFAHTFLPLGRVGQSAELAPLYVGLAEDSDATGSIWSANGGDLGF